jgi:nucleoside-diphosphate-sugar epimerase
MISRLWSTSIPTTIVRPFNYTGNGQGKQFVIPKIVHHFAQRKASIELGNLDVAREFNDVRFVADVYTKLLEIDSASIEATLNICTGRTYTLLEVIRELSDITGNSINIVVDERFVRSNDPKVLGGDPQTLRSVIPDQEQFRLRDTLQWMLNSST